MTFDLSEIISSMLNGEPLHDAITCGIVFTCFYEFYKVFFSTVFSFFSK